MLILILLLFDCCSDAICEAHAVTYGGVRESVARPSASRLIAPSSNPAQQFSFSAALAQTTSYQSASVDSDDSTQQQQQPPSTHPLARMFCDANTRGQQVSSQHASSSSTVPSADNHSVIDIPSSSSCGASGGGGGSSCAAEAAQSHSLQADNGDDAGWFPVPLKLHGMTQKQRIELTGVLARPLVQSTLGGGFAIAILFLVFIFLHLIRII